MNHVRFGLVGVATLFVAPAALAQDCLETVWTADIENYADGENIITGQACYPECPPGARWESFEDDPDGVGATASAAFGNPGLSIDIRGTRAIGPDDLVHTFHDFDVELPGAWRIAADLYAPEDMAGESYFILLSQYTNDGKSSTEVWATQVHIDGDEGRLESDFDGGTVALEFDVWRRFEVLVDFGEDRQQIRYDGQMVNLPDKSWTGGVSNCCLKLEALTLYGNDADAVYWDNFEICSIAPEGACCFRSDPCVGGIERADCEGLQGDAVFQGIGSSCGACRFYGPNGWVIDDLMSIAPPFTWEGDTCNDYPGIPFNADCEFFPQDCSECALEPSQEQAWQFMIPWEGTWTFSTCGAADFDTQIFAGTATCQGELGFNDDCGRIAGEDDSELAVVLGALDQVSITLEGFSANDCGSYTLSVGAPCPEIALGADQETTGPCFDDDLDPENRGCNADPDDPLSIPTFTDIACGTTFAGTVGNFTSEGRLRRDFDWFRLDLAEAMEVTLDAVGNYPQVELYLIRLNASPGSGEDECTDAGGILASDATPTCVDENGDRAAARVVVQVAAGSYAPVVTTAFVDPALPVALGGVPCGSPYELTVTCQPGTCGTGDLTGDGSVTFADLLVVLAEWGGAGPDGDANCDGVVNFQDLLVILAAWT